MKTIEATYRIVTPMFIGGADGNPTDGIRPPSFKGALRFWWRALNWSRYFQQENEHEANALKALHKEEERLFGASARVENGKISGGQGVFLLTVQETAIPKPQKVWPKANTGAGYLAYGILESKGGRRGTPVPHKSGIEEGLRFTVTLRFNPKTTDDQIESIREALNVIGLLGGLGSRSRRGFGSLSIEREGKLTSLDDYNRQLTTVFNNNSVMANFTTFNKNCLYKLLSASNDARDSLNKAGTRYKEYRSSINHAQNKRISFGLPLQEVDEKTRRASPLFFHVQALENNQSVTVVFFIPTTLFHHEQHYQRIQFDSVREFVGEFI